jgi:hypothetical protein
MGDYYSILSRAVSALSDNTAHARQHLYEQARVALTSSLLRHDPPMSEADFERERSAFEADITRVEREAFINQTPTADAPADETSGSSGPANILPAAQIKEDQVHPTVSALGASIAGVAQEPSIGQTQTADGAKAEPTQSQPADETTGSTGPVNVLPAALSQIRDDLAQPTVSALEAGIKKVEQALSIGQTQTADAAKTEPTQAHPVSQETNAANGPADTLPAVLRSIRDPTLPRIMPIRKTFVYVNRVLLGVTCVISIAFATTIFLRPSWVTLILGYLLFAAYSAVILCTLGMLPIAQAKVSKVGLLCTFLVSSYLLGMTTWLLGVLITLQYWGKMGLVIGLCLGIVGVVPLGIVAAIMNADWSMVAMMIIGMLVTYGARDLALERIDTETSSAISA